MGLNTAASLSFSQINSALFFTNGNLGVNTTAPAFNLDVNGTVNASGKSTLQNFSATNISATNFITTSVSAGLLVGTNIIYGNNISAGTLSATTISGANLSLSGNLTIGGTVTTVRITSSNIVDTNLSIGTLTVSGASTLANTVITNLSSGTLNASTGFTTGSINATGTSSLLNTTATNISTGTLIASGTSTLLNTTATNISTGILIASTGITSSNIRINSGTASSGLYLQGSNLDGAVLKLENTSGLTYAVGSTATGSGAGRGFSIYDATNSVSRLLVGSSGNIGINTTVPAFTLDVLGNINATTSITTAALSATAISAGSIRTSSLTTGALLASSGITVGSHIRLNNNTVYLRDGNIGNGGMNWWAPGDGFGAWGNTGGMLGLYNTTSPSLYWNSNRQIGIGGLISNSLSNKLSINTTTDTPAINSDACNTLLVYEDMQGTSLRSGQIQGVASYIQNTGVQLTPGGGGNEFGQWYWNMNPGNAFTVDYEIQVSSYADGHMFFWGANAAPSTNHAFEGLPAGYTVGFNEYLNNGQIQFYYNNSLLTTVVVGTLRNSNWVKIRIVYQRNVIKVYYNGALQINYKDTARHLNMYNNYMGFTAGSGGGAGASAHRIRELKIQKLSEGLWSYQSQTSGNILFNGGNVGINTSSTTAYTFNVNGGTMIRGNLYSTSVPASTSAIPLPKASGSFGWNGSVIVANNLYNCTVARTGTGNYYVTFTNAMSYSTYIITTSFHTMGVTDFVQYYGASTAGFNLQYFSADAAADNTNLIGFVVW